MTYLSRDVLEAEVVTDLKTELSEDGMFNERILVSKVRNAVREVMAARRYPSGYTEEMVLSDLPDYYSNIRNIALYDYNQTGAEFQTSSNENGDSRSYMSRAALFDGIVPLAATV